MSCMTHASTALSPVTQTLEDATPMSYLRTIGLCARRAHARTITSLVLWGGYHDRIDYCLNRFLSFAIKSVV